MNITIFRGNDETTADTVSITCSSPHRKLNNRARPPDTKMSCFSLESFQEPLFGMSPSEQEKTAEDNVYCFKGNQIERATLKKFSPCVSCFFPLICCPPPQVLCANHIPIHTFWHILQFHLSYLPSNSQQHWDP